MFFCLVKVYNHLMETSDDNRVKKFRETHWRWFALLFACLGLVGSYFCYDNPQALEDPLTEPEVSESAII